MSYEEKKINEAGEVQEPNQYMEEEEEEEVQGLDEDENHTLTLNFPYLENFKIDLPRADIGLSMFLVKALENEDDGDFTLDLNFVLKNGNIEKVKQAIRGVVHWIKTYKDFVNKENEITPARPYTNVKTPSMIVFPNGEKVDKTFLDFFSDESKVIDDKGLYDESNIDLPFGVFMEETLYGIKIANHLMLKSGLDVLSSFVALALKGKHFAEQEAMLKKHFTKDGSVLVLEPKVDV